ncbi:MAG TPA: cupin domain-containing protein [Candidatus Xenobia bacterium]|nr:cupin domain-containing protein [Candidatus Xenobia bacterium]
MASVVLTPAGGAPGPEGPCQEPPVWGDPAKETGSWMRPAEKPPNLDDYVIKLNQMHTFYDVPGEYGHALEGHEHGFNSLSFIVTETHPGGGPPLHTHDTEEAHVLLGGSAGYVIGDKTFRAEGPYIARVPAGTPHTFINAGGRVMRLVAVFPDKKISYHEVGANPLVKKK